MSTWHLVGPTGNVLDLTGLRPQVVPVVGAGMPRTDPVLTVEQEGGVYQGMLVSNRDLRLQLTLRRGSIFATRAAIIAALNPLLVTELAPAYLRYIGLTKTVQVPVVYRAGLETIRVGTFGLHLHTLDPYWTNVAQSVMALTPYVAFAPSEYVIQRQGMGWVALSSVGGIVNALLTVGSTLYAGGAFGVKSWNGSAWGSLGTVGGVASALVVSPGNTIYAGGAFGVKFWTGSAWTSVGSLANVKALAFDAAGNLWAGNTTDVWEWDGSAWQARGFGGAAYALLLARGSDVLYAGGTVAGGVKRWTGAGWLGLGQGITLPASPTVYALLLGDDGTLYAGGAFTHADGQQAFNIARWNGSVWRPLASGLSSPCRSLCWFAGNLYAGGEFTVAGGEFVPGYAAIWNGSGWLPVDVDPGSSGQSVQAMAVLPSGLVFGTLAPVLGGRAGVTTAIYGGDVPVAPRCTVVGPGRCFLVLNDTTQQALYVDVYLWPAEVMTVDFANRTITSSTRGNLLGRMVPGSNLATWRLNPGQNVVMVYVDDAAAAASLAWYERFHALVE